MPKQDKHRSSSYVRDNSSETPISLGKEHIEYPCGYCLTEYHDTVEGIQCYDCKAWAHRKCASVLAKHYELLKEDEDDVMQWICAKCRGDSNNKRTMAKKV